MIALLAVTFIAATEPRLARDTADVGAKGSWSMGVFNPLQVALHDRVELKVHPALFFVAPHFDFRFALLKPPRGEDLRVTTEVGLSMPTIAMRLLKGYLFFPTWNRSADDVGWMLIPHVGLLVSDDVFSHDTWTLRADVAFRVLLGPNSATPLDSFLAPLEILLAAPLTGLCVRAGGAYDHAFGNRLRLRGSLDLYLTGDQGRVTADAADVGRAAAISSLIITAHLGLDIAVFKDSRITLGVLYANYDQGATRVVVGNDGYADRVRVRSNNFLPTLDYIWAGF